MRLFMDVAGNMKSNNCLCLIGLLTAEPANALGLPRKDDFWKHNRIKNKLSEKDR